MRCQETLVLRHALQHRLVARVVEDRSSETLTVNQLSADRSANHRYGLNLDHDSSIRIPVFGRVARTINPKKTSGAQHVGFTCGAFDFAFFFLVPHPQEPFTPPPRPFNPQILPFTAKHLTT